VLRASASSLRRCTCSRYPSTVSASSTLNTIKADSKKAFAAQDRHVCDSVSGSIAGLYRGSTFGTMRRDAHQDHPRTVTARPARNSV
jgi:hypothetical protein